MTIRAVFFDLDDTLCQTTATRRDRARLSAEVLLPHAKDEDLDTLITRMLAPHPKTGFPLGAQPLIDELGIAGTQAAATAIGIWFFQGCEQLLRGYDGAEEAIRVLQASYSLGVITNGNHDIQRNKLNALAIGAHFRSNLFLASEAVGHAKPNPRIFEHALGLAGVQPPEALMVGDWLEVDVLGAQAVGMRGVWFTRSIVRRQVGSSRTRPFAASPSCLSC